MERERRKDGKCVRERERERRDVWVMFRGEGGFCFINFPFYVCLGDRAVFKGWLGLVFVFCHLVFV